MRRRTPAQANEEQKRQVGGSEKRATTEILRSAPYLSEIDFADFFYKPHTLFAGFVLVTSVFALWKQQLATDQASTIRLGLGCAAWAFVIFGTIHLPDGIMVRPHPAVWRFFQAIAVLYMMIMIFLFFQDLSTIKQIFAWYDPTHLTVWPEQSYATDCRMSTPEEPYKFWYTVSDIFLVAHAMGYWAKALVLRDWRIVTAVSIGFELIEVSLQHQLPNFKECWWDHLIVDVLICNGGGTILGLLTLRFFKAKKYHWVRLRDIPTIGGKASRMLGQLGPRSFDSFTWDMFQSPKRFVQVLFVLGAMFLNEVNCFTMKSILNQKPTYHLVFLRLAMWGFIALPAMREYYIFVSDPNCKRLGTIAWVGCIALFFETAVIAKMTLEGGYFQEATPAVIGIPWMIVGTMWTIWTLFYFGIPALRRFFVTRWLLNLIFYSSFLILFIMCCMANVDLMWGQKEFNAFVRENNLW